MKFLTRISEVWQTSACYLIGDLNRCPKDPDVRSKFYRNKKVYKQVIKSKKRSFKENLLKSIQETEDKNPKVFWNFVNDIKAKKRANPSDNIEPSVWYEWFKKLNKSSVPLEDNFTLPILENIEKFTTAYDEILDSEISVDEISKATLKLKNGKSVGDDMISNEMIKCCVDSHFVRVIHYIFNAILQSSKYPDAWKHGLITPLFKSGDTHDPNDYRGITVTSCFSKLFNAILNRRLVRFTEINSLKYPNQIGFSEGYRTSDHVFVLNTLLGSYFSRKAKVYACFVDFSKAYDSVWRDGLYYKLLGMNISCKFITLLRSMYANLKASVKLTDGITQPFVSKTGVRQGCNLSPTLFNLFINDIVGLFDEQCLPPKMGNQNINCLMYADDILILSETEEGLRRSLSKLEDYSQRWKLNVNVKKTKILVFNKAGRNIKLSVRFGNNHITSCENYKYLGTIFVSSGSFKLARIALHKKAARAFFSFLSDFSLHSGIKPCVIQKLFKSLVEPILLYNSEVWGAFLLSYSRNASFNRFTENLFDDKLHHENLQNRLCKILLGVHSKSSNFAVRGEMGLYPLNVTIYERILKFYFHLLDLRTSNPIIDNALLECSSLHAKGLSSLLTVVQHLLRISGHNLDSVAQARSASRKGILMSVSRSLKTLYINRFREHIQGSGRLSQIYQFIKRGYGEELYVNSELKHEHRSIVAKFRISAHFLPIELGRMQQKPRSQRTCTFCADTPLGDEAHFILRCSEPSLVEARDKYFGNMSDSFGGEWDRGDNEILTKMLGSMNITTNTETITFLQRILCICKDLRG